ncbi:MAG: hypothetical protein JO022_06465 [Acidobacteriaceae bacterium]|nr:hypothetical protein [Acidobacteriaceae bacterium]
MSSAPSFSDRPLRLTAASVLLASATAFCQNAEGPLDFEKADREVTRLSPSRFPRLPLPIRHDLTRRGCTVPQVWGEKGLHNVIKGSFIQRTEPDWAVLCSVNRTSTILIFRNASATRIVELARGTDINWLQSEGGTQIGYSREIFPVGREFIMRHYQTYGGVKPPPIDHLGINDAFVGKASVVLYHYRGKWLKLTGAD